MSAHDVSHLVQHIWYNGILKAQPRPLASGIRKRTYEL